jgi:5-methylcytosine-specific restriction endonuclease McrA
MSAADEAVISGNSRRLRSGHCPFCRRDGALTFHHLIPKKVHRRARFARRYSRQQLQQGIFVCRDCHGGIHDAYDEMSLAMDFNTPALLAADPGLQRHFRWVAKQRRR